MKRVQIQKNKITIQKFFVKPKIFFGFFFINVTSGIIKGVSFLVCITHRLDVK